jgi:hypothetical protein
MKKNLLSIFLLLTSALAFGQTTLPGNGNMGFGGSVGTSNLTISESGSNITFTLGTARPDGNALVIYIDSKAGGFANTNTLEDEADGGRRAISGDRDFSTDQSELTFPSGFEPDYAVAWGDYGFVLFELVAGGNNSLGYLNFQNNASTATIDKGLIGITGAINFKVVTSLISGSGFRSNESHTQSIMGGNPGWTDVTYSTFATYPGGVLPIGVTRFSAAKQNTFVNLGWQLNCASGGANVSLQRSTDGINFTTVYNTTADYNRCKLPFAYTDNAAPAGKVYYRLQIVNDNGVTKYSNIAMVGGEKDEVTVNMVPTLVKNQTTLQLSVATAQTASLRIVNMAGQLVKSQSLNLQAGSQNQLIDCSLLKAGVYTAIVTLQNAENQLVRFVKE